MSWPWSQLGLSGPAGLPEVRRAYAEKLKTTHPEDDPEGFQRLHSAYQLASRIARQQKRREGEQHAQFRTEEERPVPPAPETSRVQEDFDFDELLKGGVEDQRRPHEEEADFNFDELLRENETPPGSNEEPNEEEEQDFDFERLFAEGEAERAEARRRRGEERRKEKRQRWERELTGRFHQEQDRWQNTETILQTIEMMYNAQAGTEVWQKFFTSPLFQQTKGSLDLIFGLEDFVSGKRLSQEVRLALFLAYGFDKGISRPELRPLFQMLLPAWKEARREKDRERNLAILGVLLGVVFPFIIGPLLDMGLVPAFIVSLGAVWIVWVVRKVVITGNIGHNVSKKKERRSIVIGVACVVALVTIMSWARSSASDFDIRKLLPTKDPREQICRYIERDFDVKVGSIYNRQYPTEENSNLFYLEPDMSKVFLAGPDGERNGANTGYTTNLPEMILFWKLKEFALAHNMSRVDALDQGLGQGEVSGTFLITLPEEDGEEIIDDLGTLLAKLREEKWYKALPPQCELVMCSREMEEGRIVLIRVHPATEVYSTAQIRSLYDDGFAHAVYAQIIRELGLDRNFILEDGEPYILTNEGIASMRGYECYKLFGLDETGAVAMEYYVYPKLRNIYCFPGDFWETGNNEDQISFYRLLHWGDRGTFNLFYPWLKT